MLKIDSFVTNLSKSKEQTVNGGATTIPLTITFDEYCQYHSIGEGCKNFTFITCSATE